MTELLPLKRGRTFQIFKELPKLSAYDEFPLTAPSIDPQLHVSFNDVDQPFFLVCAKDCVLVQLTGKGRVLLRDTSVREFRTKPGTFVYIPAGAAHRIVVEEPGAWLRYKAEAAGLEGVEWVCDDCGTQLYREVFDTADVLPQTGWLTACQHLNARPELRDCESCGLTHAEIDLSPFRWSAIAATIEAEAEPADAWD